MKHAAPENGRQTACLNRKNCLLREMRFYASELYPDAYQRACSAHAAMHNVNHIYFFCSGAGFAGPICERDLDQEKEKN